MSFKIAEKQWEGDEWRCDWPALTNLPDTWPNLPPELLVPHKRISICSHAWNYCSTQSFWLECTFNRLFFKSSVTHKKYLWKKWIILLIKIKKQNIRMPRTCSICVPVPAQACCGVTAFTCSVREPSEATTSISHLSLYLSPAVGGLTLWNACCHLSSITTCCCPILPGLYCLGFILDKSRKALRFMGLGWV